MTDSNSDLPDAIRSELLRDDSGFADIVQQFVAGLPQRLVRMQDAIRAADFEALRAAAHQLKGCGGGYGYPILTERAAELEQHAKNRAVAECATILDELTSLCQRVVAEP